MFSKVTATNGRKQQGFMLIAEGSTAPAFKLRNKTALGTPIYPPNNPPSILL